MRRLLLFMVAVLTMGVMLAAFAIPAIANDPVDMGDMGEVLAPQRFLRSSGMGTQPTKIIFLIGYGASIPLIPVLKMTSSLKITSLMTSPGEGPDITTWEAKLTKFSQQPHKP